MKLWLKKRHPSPFFLSVLTLNGEPVHMLSPPPKCVVPEDVSVPYPWMLIENSRGGGGVFLKECVNLLSLRNFSPWGEYGYYFSGTLQYKGFESVSPITTLFIQNTQQCMRNSLMTTTSAIVFMPSSTQSPNQNKKKCFHIHSN